MYNSEVKKKADPAPDAGDEPSDKVEEKPQDFTEATSALADEISKLDSVKALSEGYDDDLTAAMKDVAAKTAEIIFGSMGKMVDGRLGDVKGLIAPIQEAQDKADNKSHVDTIVDAHPDFEKYVENRELSEWVESKVGLLGDAYKNAYKNGSTAQIVEMVAAFRDEKGYADKEPEKEIEKDVDTDKLENMEAVDTVKSPASPSGGKKKGAQDYDGAWEEADK
jgi:hypothetical protein